MTRKCILLAACLIPLGFASVALAATADFVALAPIPGLTSGEVAESTSLPLFFNNLYKYLIGVAAALAVVMIIWEGLRIAANQDSVSVIVDSKGKIYNAIFGLILVLSPALVFGIINPQILNLQLNLGRIDLDFTVSTPPVVNSNADQRAGQWCFRRFDGTYSCAADRDACLSLMRDTPSQTSCRQY